MIAKRKNRTLQEMARVMLCACRLSKVFWAEALNTACHIKNRVNLRLGTTMTSYEIILNRKPNLKFFHVFGCICYILNDREYITKFDSKSDNAVFIGYSDNSHAYQIFNLRTKFIQESVNVVFDDYTNLAGKMRKIMWKDT